MDAALYPEGLDGQAVAAAVATLSHPGVSGILIVCILALAMIAMS